MLIRYLISLSNTKNNRYQLSPKNVIRHLFDNFFIAKPIGGEI